MIFSPKTDPIQTSELASDRGPLTVTPDIIGEPDPEFSGCPERRCFGKRIGATALHWKLADPFPRRVHLGNSD